jgi:hypothetical protein
MSIMHIDKLYNCATGIQPVKIGNCDSKHRVTANALARDDTTFAYIPSVDVHPNVSEGELTERSLWRKPEYTERADLNFQIAVVFIFFLI